MYIKISCSYYNNKNSSSTVIIHTTYIAPAEINNSTVMPLHQYSEAHLLWMPTYWKSSLSSVQLRRTVSPGARNTLVNLQQQQQQQSVTPA